MAQNHFRGSCWFCHKQWEKCTCKWDEKDGFTYHDFFIYMPNVTECGRFFVDPVTYYGDAFIEWWKQKMINWKPT